MNNKKYYEAYNERYKTIHQKGRSWSSDISTPIVMETIAKYGFSKIDPMIEVGCGEGRDSKPILEAGYNLLATDVSEEAIKYCEQKMLTYCDSFAILDCLKDQLDVKFRFIFAVAVIHMLVLDEDRQQFYKFIYNHLQDDGVALICSMGDGETEVKSDVNEAFMLKEREHPKGKVKVAATSCRMVNTETFKKEIESANLVIIENGITSSMPDFNNLMYAVVKKHS